MCGSVFHEGMEWDHIAPLHSTCQSTEQIFQALCSACHSDKSALQGKEARTLVSRVSRYVWREGIR